MNLRALRERYLPAGSLRLRLAGGALWTTIGGLTFQLSAMLTSIGSARILGESHFGELSMIRSTVLLFGVLAGTGLGIPATKYVAQYRTADPARAARLLGLILNVALVLSTTGALLFILLAHPISVHILKAGSLVVPMRIGAVLMAFNVLNGVQMAAIGGFEHFRGIAALLVFDSIAALACTLGGAYVYGVTGALGGAAVAAAAAAVIKHRVLLAQCRKWSVELVHRGLRAELPAVGSMLVPALLIGVSTQPFEWLARTMLARGSGFAEVGIFSAAYAWAVAVPFFATQITAPALSVLSNMHGTSNRAGFLRVVRGLGFGAIGLTMCISLPVMALSSWIMRTYGPSFAGASGVLVLLACAYTISPLSSVFRAALVATGNVWSQNLHAIIWGVTLSTAYYFLWPYGAAGLACSYLIAYAVVLVTQGTSVALASRNIGEQPA